MVISAVRRQICERLELGGVADASFDTDELMCYALGVNRTQMSLFTDKDVDEKQIALLDELAKRRIAGEPLQYILGEWEFYGMPFYVGDGVLIPRADTEVLVDCALSFLKTRQNADVIDLCSGSGCIAISVKKNAPSVSMTAVELYDKAYDFLVRNAERNHSEINIVKADVLQKSDGFGMFDLILTNPPYIEAEVVPTLSKEVQSEPITALDGGKDGLDYYRAIAENWLPLIKSNGCIIAEIGEDQAQSVTHIFKSKGLLCETVKDLNGLDRVIVGTK